MITLEHWSLILEVVIGFLYVKVDLMMMLEM